MQQMWVEDGHNKIQGGRVLNKKERLAQWKEKKKQNKHDKSSSLGD